MKRLLRSLLYAACLFATPFMTRAQLQSITPNQGNPGQTLATTITAASSIFTAASQQAPSIYLHYSNTYVYSTGTTLSTDSTTAYTSFTIPSNAPLAFYNLSVYFPSNGSSYQLNNAFQVGTYTVTGRVFNDLNLNGVLNAGEPGIANQQILVLPDSVYVTTDAQGNYLFEGVNGNSYTLKWKPDPGYMLVAPDSINVTLNTYVTNKNFGIHAPIDAFINGHVFYDINGNGVEDTGEPPLSNQHISIAPDGYVILTDANGNFTYGGTFATTYTVAVVPNAGWSVSSTNTSYTFTLTGNVSNLNFGLSGPPPAISMLFNVSHCWASCNQPRNFPVHLVNTGTVMIDTGYIKFVKPSSTPFVNANPPADLIVGDTLYWYFHNLDVGQSLNYYAQLLIPGPGPTLECYGYAYGYSNTIGGIYASGYDDEIVTCAFDPNDKAANSDTLRGPTKPLDYTIRFQNTGTDTAHIVIVRDTLSTLLDYNSFQFVYADHPVTVELHPSSHSVSFVFYNIMLPDSNVNEPASHGYFSYRIYPAAGLPIGSVIHNYASIYFDVNAPVPTGDAPVTYCNRDTLNFAVHVCQGDSVLIGNNWQSQPGTYVYHSSSASVCDLLNNVNLIISPLPNASVVANGGTVNAPAGAAAYQWIDCSNGANINGATSQSFTATVADSYAVIVTDSNGCHAVSPCVALLGIMGVNQPSISLVPNPASDFVTLSIPAGLTDAVACLQDISGRTILTQKLGSSVTVIPVGNVSTGVYMLCLLQNGRTVSVRKLTVVRN